MRKLLLALSLLAILLFTSMGGIFWASKHVPTFYEQALTVDTVKQKEQGEQLERNVLELHNDVQRTGGWEAKFTEDEVNGWLAFDLPKKFASALPKTLREPRVAIHENQIEIACRYESSKVNSVISLSVEVALTDRPNELMVRINRVRAGMLPVPIGRFLDDITKVAEKADLNLRWIDDDGDHVALLIIPETYEGYDQRIIRVESVEVKEAEIHVKGQTKPLSKDELSALKTNVKR